MHENITSFYLYFSFIYVFNHDVVMHSGKKLSNVSFQQCTSYNISIKYKVKSKSSILILELSDI